MGSALTDVFFELILVDDGSTDETGPEIEQHEHPWLRVITFPENRGQSAALYAGIMASQAPVIAMIDGDLQLKAVDILTLRDQLIPGIDLVCGYRLDRQDSASKRL